MTSRQTGRRLRTVSRRRPAGKKQSLTPGELRHLAQLVACGGIFVLLVAAKLLLPGKMEGINQRLSEAMRQNMDVEAVFSAVGRAFAGEGGAGEAVEDVYQAVFRPQAQTPPVKSRTLRLQDGAALAVLQTCRPPAASPEKEAGQPPAEAPEADGGPSAPEPEGTEGPGTGTEDASTLAYVLYSQENLPEGVSMEQAILGFDYTTPVMGVLSSGFGYREHPIEGEERFHYGVDLAADSGTEVGCFADGTVTAVGESSSYGRYCIVTHEGGYATLYAHCSRVVASSGAQVSRGQKIAEVGQTGMATGPHLHFELHLDGKYLNPIYYVSTL